VREAPSTKDRATIERPIRKQDEILASEKYTRVLVEDAADKTTPVKVAETTKPVEPAKGQPKPIDASAANATRVAPKTKLAAVMNPLSLPLPPAKAELAPSAGAAHSAPQATKPPATTAVATPRPSAPAAATPGTQAQQPQPVVEKRDGGILTRWWFWTAAGALAIGAGATAATLGGNAPPASHFGNHGI
jgi:hypothetical protein